MKTEIPREQATLPIVEEQLRVDKRRVETGRVRVRTVVDERLARVSEDLVHENVSIERVPVDREVAQPPEVREENGVLIVPVCEEVLVVEKRLVVREELHIRKNREHERFEEAVRVRGMRVDVERVNAGPTQRSGDGAADQAPVSPAAIPHEPGAGEPLTARRRLHRKPPLRPRTK
jgi:uncharacterized protein (TIGR02271 family)